MLLALPLGYAPLEMVYLGGGADLVNISASFLREAVCLSPNAVIGIMEIGLTREWVRSVAACVA